jgi:pyruvate kinase
MMDLRGRSIRTSNFNSEVGVTFKVGDKVELRCDGAGIESNHVEIQINNSEVASVMREGDIVYLGDNGQIYGNVVETARTSFVVEIKAPGTLKSHALVKIPGSRY